MGEHAVYAPSSMYRIMACPGSFKAALAVPKGKSSSYAEHGTWLHKLVPELWPIRHDPMAVDQLIDSMLYKTIYPEAEPDADKQYVLSCIDYIESVLVTCGGNYAIAFEERVDLTSWGLPDVWGTADVIITDIDNRRIIVIDWKFGSGVPVYTTYGDDPNEQGMTYLIGAAGFPPYMDSYEMHIVQPPIDNYPPPFTCDPAFLKDYTNKIHLAIEATKAVNAPLVSGERQCQFCPARMVCRERYDSAMKDAAVVFQTYGKVPNVTPEELEKAYFALQNIKKYEKTLIAHMLDTMMKTPDAYPNLKLVSGRSNRKWRDDKAAMSYLISTGLSAEHILKKTTMNSPAGMEKINRHFKKDEQFQLLVTKPPGKPQITDVDDPREAYNSGTQAAGVFANFGKEK